ncbi:MAG: hypothetical protein AAGC65_25085 [Mucilaginibacter sp.]|uniref:hypothetical protein n=1 Tax=Mucilaginibacter sp. TaxID=1882438 RepID=UPI0031A07F3A
MATDKKISELAVASSINSTDISVIVRDGTDYQYNFTQLIEYLSTNLVVGTKMTFGTVLPQNNTGKNGDVFLNTNTGNVYQKINSVWTNTYIPVINTTPDSTVLYNTGAPLSNTGGNNDTYIDVLTGIFYKKIDNAWSQVFSISSGPQGPRGSSILNGTTDPVNSTGVNGDFYINTTTLAIFGPKASGVWPAGKAIKGTNANTIFNGTGNPSNSIGNNGDFYLDTDNYKLYGPKINNDWPAGISLIYVPTEPVTIQIPAGSPIPFTINYADNYSEYGNDPSIIIEMNVNDNTKRVVWDVIVDKNYSFDTLDSIDVYAHDSGDGLTSIDNITLTIKP